MPEFLANTNEIRSAIQELKAASAEMDAKLLKVNNTLINILRNWRSPRLQKTIEKYDVWRQQNKELNEQFFSIIRELESTLEENEMANR